MTNALKPCPFCGAPPLADFDDINNHYIVCDSTECNAACAICHGDSRAEAEAKWNTRAKIVVTDEMVEMAMRAYFGDNKIGVNDRVYGVGMRAALEAALNGEAK